MYSRNNQNAEYSENCKYKIFFSLIFIFFIIINIFFYKYWIEIIIILIVLFSIYIVIQKKIWDNENTMHLTNRNSLTVAPVIATPVYAYPVLRASYIQNDDNFNNISLPVANRL